MKKDKEVKSDTKEDLKNIECENSDNNTNISEEKINENQKTIGDLEDEVSSLKDTLLRKMAEIENLRKRLEKERDDAEKYANSRFARDLLSVVDNFNRVSDNSKAISEKINGDANLKGFFDGMLLCGKELTSVFKKHGITQIEVSEGDPFDPQYHQAMLEIESKDHKPGSVINVLQVGYVYHDRLLRPSMVSVSKK